VSTTKIPIPDVIVLLPGITGSVLRKDGKDVWAPSAGAALRALLSLGKSVQVLDVADDDWHAADLGDGVTATALMPDVHLLPGLWKIDGYGEIEKFLLDTFDLTKDVNYFPFPYDWRRDNRASALRLQELSTGWLANWRRTSGNDAAQLVLIGHSMGGLISRYFVEALGGWRDTRAVVTFGTPFYGSLNALDFLVHGYKKKVGPFGIDLTKLLRSLRAIHQLVPSYRCVYSGGVAATPANAGLPGWDPAWDTARRDFQQEMDAGARANRDDAAYEENPVVYRPIVGTDQLTKQSAVITGGTVDILNTRDSSDEGGDGTVPLLSAALAGTEEQRTFAPEQHARLQNYDSMLAHLKGAVSSLYQVRIEDLRAARTAWFSYAAEALYLPEEPFTIRLATCSAVDESLLPAADAMVTVTDRTTGAVPIRRTLRVPQGPLTEYELGMLAPGTYQVDVTGGPDTAPLSDVAVVAAPTDLE
jgi:Lecithin:cholesterol acyltransferase